MGATITVAEERLYKWIQLILLGICTFAILRLYNAVAVNSGYTSKLQKELNLFVTQLKSDSRSTANDNREVRSTMNTLKQSVDNLRAQITVLIAKMK